MPQNEAKFQINQFTGGLVTDANPLAAPGPISIDENNCEILPHGGRRRRRGAELEVAYATHGTVLTDTQKEAYAFQDFQWNAVAGIPGLEFVVYQQGSRLWFYSKSTSSLSSGLKSTSIDMSTFKTDSATTAELEGTRVSVATGKGVIFVAASTIDPFYVEYDEASDSITATQIVMKIRDFEEQSPDIGPQDEVRIFPGSNGTTPGHLYDLLNQGWYQLGPYTTDNGSTNRDNIPVLVKYQGHTATDLNLPRKNTPWHAGRYYVVGEDQDESNAYISPQRVRSSPSGSTLAPFGHYILDAFNKDRAQAIKDENDFTQEFMYTNIDLLPVEVETRRPNATAFYAGRAWYVLDNNVYFSQQLDQDSLEKAGKCYQEGDPTNEGESDIVATDGGLIPIPNMGRATGLAVMDNVLIITADNGVWSVAGSGGSSFTAVDYTVNKLSNISVQSPASIVEAEGLVMFWGETGIYAVTPGEIRDVPAIKDLTEQRITKFYNAIPQSSKRNVFGIYEPRNKVIHWLYKGATDSAGPSVNRFAYDRFLNFSVKFSAFYPWSIDNTDSHQVIGAAVSSGLISEITDEPVVNNSGEDVVTSTGELVTTPSASVVEVDNTLKLHVLKDNAATFGEFSSLSFLDWDDEGEGTDYTSFIETFYHMQDDTMAYMQAPYIYTYFRRTEDDSLTSPSSNFSFDEFTTGGLAFDSEFISETPRNGNATNARINSSNTFMIGEDGVRYQAYQGGSGAGSGNDQLIIYNVDTGATVAALAKSESDVLSDAISNGIVPSGGHITGTADILSWTGIPGTAYLIAIVNTYSGVSVSKAVVYYRITEDTTLEVIGGYACKTDGLSTQFSPDGSSASAFDALGIVNGPKTSLGDSDDRATVQNTASYQYPIAVAYAGEGRTTILVLPSINDVQSGNVTNDSGSTPWAGKENSLNSHFDSNIFYLQGTPAGSGLNSRGVFLPRSGSSRSMFLIKWYQNDITQHIAGSEGTTSSFLQTYDSANSTGFMSSIDIVNTSAPTNSFGFTTAVSNVVPSYNGRVSGFPFTDETDDYDGSAGTASDNYYLNPSAFPIYPEDIQKPWMLFYPKIFRGETDSIQITSAKYDPTTGNITVLDTVKGQFVDYNTDTASTGWEPLSASVYWDNQTGDLYVQVRTNKGTEVDNNLITAKFGTYEPTINGIGSFFALRNATEDDELPLVSSCYLNTRWDWSNSSASGRVSSDIQVYRTGRLQFSTDGGMPADYGMPVYVSKTKTRGRGRALQLKFRSEQGKDFELYGWAVWAAKNTRF